MDTSELAKRMKLYESVPNNVLMKRTPVILRLDGKAFHTFTKGFHRPFDTVLVESMQDTMKYLCENVQGCVLGYHQSDEITLVLIDYKKLNSAAWLDYKVDKMCSIAASMATLAFNRAFKERAEQAIKECQEYEADFDDELEDLPKIKAAYEKAIYNGALFDCRAFNIPKEEVTNYFYWRQLDASRNSIQMVGQANFSHKELQYKSCNDIQDMLMTQKGINWNDFPTYQKRGSCVIRTEIKTEKIDTMEEMSFGENKKSSIVNIERQHWIIDKDIPIFKGKGRQYIERFVNVGEV